VEQFVNIDELAMLLGYKEIELFRERKQLAQTRQVLEQITAGEKEDGEAQATANDPATAQDDAGDNSEPV